jgi:hypothetical protein
MAFQHEVWFAGAGTSGARACEAIPEIITWIASAKEDFRPLLPDLMIKDLITYVRCIQFDPGNCMLKCYSGFT